MEAQGDYRAKHQGRRRFDIGYRSTLLNDIATQPIEDSFVPLQGPSQASEQPSTRVNKHESKQAEQQTSRMGNARSGESGRLRSGAGCEARDQRADGRFTGVDLLAAATQLGESGLVSEYRTVLNASPSTEEMG